MHYLMESVCKEKGDGLRVMHRLLIRGTGWVMFSWMADTTLRFRTVSSFTYTLVFLTSGPHADILGI